MSEELNYIEDYIQLQQIRLKKPLKFRFEKQIDNENLQIAPLLIIVLIENAFKHGIEPAENEATLLLSLKADQKQLYFSCMNSMEEDKSEKISGIGLSNLKKRLALLYPNTHVLETKRGQNQYTATLEITL
ncbi:MAG: hypothetical protein EOO07_22740 [Chitinophagaceae bacterium]|nr:MAG: hypothetical protein EOO07_22740 [Chitinophagaceae bacterium]